MIAVLVQDIVALNDCTLPFLLCLVEMIFHFNHCFYAHVAAYFIYFEGVKTTFNFVFICSMSSCYAHLMSNYSTHSGKVTSTQKVFLKNQTIKYVFASCTGNNIVHGIIFIYR